METKMANEESNKYLQKLKQQVYMEDKTNIENSEFERVYIGSDENTDNKHNLEKKLAYLVIKKRYQNLCSFLEMQQKKYNAEKDDIEELKRLWFLYNDLKEVEFIGPDIYSDSMFIKHRVPYLYRSIGRDHESGRALNDGSKQQSNEMGKIIFSECLEQIKTGGKGKLFSYSKCFGKMLIKYSNILWCDTKTQIEIRKDAMINAIKNNSGDEFSIQRYIREIKENARDEEIQLFAVDMSNSRDDKVENLKKWMDTFFEEKQNYRYRNNIVDPIGDAEVVTNFTGNTDSVMCSWVRRYTLNVNEYCTLLYRYALLLSEKINKKDQFVRLVNDAINTMPEHGTNFYYTLYKCIIDDKVRVDNGKIEEILNYVDLDNEVYYMYRVKGEKKDSKNKIQLIDIFKEDNLHNTVHVWKFIIDNAISEERCTCYEVNKKLDNSYGENQLVF